MKIKIQARGFTLIELLIVIAIIGILASIAIPLYKSQSIKARIAEVTNSIGYVATASASHYQETGEWPTATNIGEIQNILNVYIPQVRIESMSAQKEGNNFIIRARMRNISNDNPRIDGNDLTLTANTGTDGAIKWIWGGSAGLDPGYIPKN